MKVGIKKLLLIGIYVCVSIHSYGQQNDDEYVRSFFLKNKIDSIEISCGFFRDSIHEIMSLDIILSADHTKIVYNGRHNVTSVNTDGLDYRKRLISYISMFYINKTKNIYELRRKRNIIYAMEYPSIVLSKYKKGRRKMIRWVTMGEFSYDIEFNPEFEEFYRFLVSLADRYLLPQQY